MLKAGRVWARLGHGAHLVTSWSRASWVWWKFLYFPRKGQVTERCLSRWLCTRLWPSSFCLLSLLNASSGLVFSSFSAGSFSHWGVSVSDRGRTHSQSFSMSTRRVGDETQTRNYQDLRNWVSRWDMDFFRLLTLTGRSTLGAGI